MNHRLRFLIRLILQSTVICFSISVHCHQTIRLLAVVAGPAIITDEFVRIAKD
jgi:hypothetical protein